MAVRMTDRISEFHDSILCHILSFLPTNRAASTSILSKRWKSIWLSVPTLDFDCNVLDDMSCSGYSLHKLMLLRETELPILSFRFNCTYSCSVRNQCDLNRLFSCVMKRGIENINISCDMKLGSSILSCKTLKVLKLAWIYVSGFSHQVDFPVLKTLHLKRMSFKRHGLISKLLSGCPILEELQIEFSYIHKDSFVSEKEFKALLPRLIKAKISCDDSIIPVDLVRNVEHLHMELAQLICCTKLPMFHNLTHVQLKFYCITSLMWDWLLQMLQRCHKLESLIIQGCEYQDKFNAKSWNDPPIVPKCLSSQLKSCCLAYCNGTESELQFAKYILQNSEVLKTMKIKYSYYADIKAKHQMTMKLSSFAKGSTMCEIFEDLVSNSVSD